jgi:hypothetical protein
MLWVQMCKRTLTDFSNAAGSAASVNDIGLCHLGIPSQKSDQPAPSLHAAEILPFRGGTCI